MTWRNNPLKEQANMSDLLGYFAMALIAFVVGFGVGKRRTIRWFSTVPINDEQLLLPFPTVAFRVRRINTAFQGWMKVSERYQLMKRGAKLDPENERKSLLAMTAIIVVRARKLAQEAEESLESLVGPTGDCSSLLKMEERSEEDV